MIPKIIHYCWFGRGEMPELALKCIESWHKHMPDYEYKLWNEDNFDIKSTPYTKEAYEAGKYAFVSDFVRLIALKEYGGIYLDTDVEIFKPLDDLLQDKAFAGFEGSKHLPVGTCIMGSEPHGEWISEYLSSYDGRHFVQEDKNFDMTTNVEALSTLLATKGILMNGLEQHYKDLHIYPTDFFSPRLTTGEYFKTENTFCDHLGACSWRNNSKGWKSLVRQIVGAKNMTRLIKLKRKLLG